MPWKLWLFRKTIRVYRLDEFLRILAENWDGKLNKVGKDVT